MLGAIFKLLLITPHLAPQHNLQRSANMQKTATRIKFEIAQLEAVIAPNKAWSSS
jgi:hypothetical protein